MNRIERLSPKRAGESFPWVVARTVSIIAAVILATWAALSTSSLFKTDLTLEITLACVVGLMFFWAGVDFFNEIVSFIYERLPSRTS
jgi:spore maturation protein SpmA